MNNKFLTLMLPIFAIFISWLLIYFLSGGSNNLPNSNDLVVPFLWSCIFIYLGGKDHVYIAINSYVIFLLILLADQLSFGDLYIEIQMSYLLLSLSVTFAFVFVYQDLLDKNSRFASIFVYIVTSVLYALPLFYIIYAVNLEVGVSKEAIYAILQSNFNESSEYVSDFISPLWIIAVLLLAIFVGFVLLKQEKKETIHIERSLLLFLVIISSSLSYLNRDDIRLYSFLDKTIKEYYYEIALFNQTQEKLKTNKIEFSADKSEEGETYIVVIGESLSKKHMSLYGYMRDTTPLLKALDDKGELIKFNNAFSSHTHTMKVLSQSLTEANQSNAKSYYDSLSIINILDKAEIETYWITNQLIKGSWDNLVSVIAHQSDNLVALNSSMGNRTTTQEYDASVIKEVDKILSKDSKANKVIFVHLMGNHSDYCSRYPSEYQKFSGTLASSEFGKLSTNNDKKINCYDNSVLYNDMVVTSIINALKKKNGVNGFLYFSDHAEDVINGKGHNADNFTYDMTQIPLIMWFSEEYKTKYQDKYRVIKDNINNLFSNDRIYDTLIGLFNIDTDRYQGVNDLTSSQYFLRASRAYTMHGKTPYAGKLNYDYFQKRNIATLKEQKKIARIIPHRVNSIGKLKDVWSNGYRAFELDIFYDDDQEHFVIGHNQGDMSGVSFEKFLTLISPSEIEKIWVDLKNVSEQNHELILKKLDDLDSRFGLKEKLIIQSVTKEVFLRKYKEAGWHISYYLPTDKIVAYLSDNNVGEMKNLAKEISEQTTLQALSSVSFDQRLYPFVKDHLEPLLPSGIVYHTWDLSVKLYANDLQTTLKNKKYYTDERVKTISLFYKSPYHL
jgi:heptose-I-phosphate ethanolaminephosphotransferase